MGVTATESIWPSRLRELRKAKSQADNKEYLLADVAKAVGCSLSYLSRLERAKARPDPATLIKLAQYYEVDPKSIELASDQQPGRRLTIEKLVGAYLRLCRQKAGLSIEGQRDKYLPMRVSAALVRQLEAGQRAFAQQDEISRRSAEAAGAASVDELKASALSSYAVHELDEVLEHLHPGLLAQASGGECYIDALDERVHVPPSVQGHMAAGDVAVLVTTNIFGPAVPRGSYLIASDGEPRVGSLAIAWTGSVGSAVIVIEGGALRPETPPQIVHLAGRRLSPVRLIVLP
jgi:transcriptional regulator with XRE-family HTH domain